MNPEYIEAASKSILFNGIDIEEVQHVLDCLDNKIAEYKKSDYVARIDDKFNGVGIVISGEAAIVKENSNGNRVIANIFSIGEMFGEVLAICGQTTWPSAIQALTDCTIMYIHPEKILNMSDRKCNYHKIILINLVRVVSQKAFILSRKVDYLSLKSINGKLSRYLLEQYALNGKPTFTMPLNREELADFLNISRPSMSRELGKMRDDGIIEFYKESIRIIDVARLEALLEK